MGSAPAPDFGGGISTCLEGRAQSGLLVFGADGPQPSRPHRQPVFDIGTNGEVVIGNKEWLIATSCSAGPAFEGGGIKHGMRATDGAIDDLESAFAAERKHRKTQYEQNCGWFSHYGDSFVCGRVRHARF